MGLPRFDPVPKGLIVWRLKLKEATVATKSATSSAHSARKRGMMLDDTAAAIRRKVDDEILAQYVSVIIAGRPCSSCTVVRQKD